MEQYRYGDGAPVLIKDKIFDLTAALRGRRTAVLTGPVSVRVRGFRIIGGPGGL